MSAYVFPSLAAAQALAPLVDAAQGYPRAGRNVGGGVHIAPPLAALASRMRLAALLLLAATACAPLRARASHAAAPTPDGREMHTCIGYTRAPFDCEEGTACTRHGCEWCGDDDGAETRCTWGAD